MSLFLKENRKTKRVTLFHSNFIYIFFIFSPPLKITQHTIKVMIWFWKPSNIQKNYTNASKTKILTVYDRLDMTAFLVLIYKNTLWMFDKINACLIPKLCSTIFSLFDGVTFQLRRIRSAKEYQNL